MVKAPVVLRAILPLCTPDPEIENYLLHTSVVRLLFELCKRSELCASGPDAPPVYESLTEPSALKDFAHLGICSDLPRLRDRPIYQADTIKDNGDEHNCRHDSRGQSKRTGGLFTWFCQHGVCYAFYIIKDCEGRNEAFSFLSCYLKKAPKVVIYDFACALHEYCLNRLPAFFKDTLFLVDRFHWYNHVACALTYSLKLYAHLNNLNSQIAEQNNSALQRVKGSVSRMTQPAFMMMLRLFFSKWNHSKSQKQVQQLTYINNLCGGIS